MLFQTIDCAIGTLTRHLTDLKPSVCGINHGQACQGDICALLFVSPAAWTDEIDAEGVPRNHLPFLGRHWTTLVGSLLETLANVASLASPHNARC